MVTPIEAQSVACPDCQAPIHNPCTKATTSGRTAVAWVHHAREDAFLSVAQQREENYFLTFGIQYYDEPHPTWPECNPKGWVRIVAPTYETAQALAIGRFGLDWSMLVPEIHFNPKLFTAGELMVLSQAKDW